MIKQCGALSYRFDAGELRILLITSRSTKRWVIPKGHPMFGRGLAGSAAREAFEEAGVLGRIKRRPIGSYCYEKGRGTGGTAPAQVTVFPLRVLEQRADWPERLQRETRWFDRAAAAAAVDEADLKAIILSFQPDQSLSFGNPVSGAAFHPRNILQETPMDDRETVAGDPIVRDSVAEKETVIVERGSGAGVIMAIAFLIIVLAVLYYLGMLPI